MQIKVKTLDKKELVIDIEETDKVEILKKKIQEAKDNDANLEPAISKLIWKGKILNNDQIVKDAGINDKGFCVIMPGKVAKKAEEPKTESSSKKEETPKKVEDKSTPAATSSSSNPPNPIPATPPAAAAPQSNINADDLITQMQAQMQISDEMITQIVAISGVEAQKAKLALTVSQGNPDLAVELILSNNLDAAVNELKRRLTGGPGAAQQNNNNTGSSENTGTSDSVTSGDRQVVNESNPLHYLTQSPMGQQMLAAIRQNPGILPQILQQISQSNPDLFQQLQDNHEAFLQLLETDGNSQTAQGSAGGSAQGGAPQQMQQQLQQGGGQRVELQISQQDREAIDRLMGISQKSEVEVVQAYMACDKNEEHALNLLFDS